MKMPKEIKDKWVAALRSGQYSQAQGTLYDGYNGYCCLGVLEKVCDGVVEDESMPSSFWWRSHEVELASAPKDSLAVTDENLTTLVDMNDGFYEKPLPFDNKDGNESEEARVYSFLEIADWIEENVEVKKDV